MDAFRRSTFASSSSVSQLPSNPSRSNTLPSIGFFDDKSKREDTERSSRPSPAMTSPASPYAGPPPPYTFTSGQQPHAATSGPIAPDARRLTHDGRSDEGLPTLRSLPSIGEALGRTSHAQQPYAQAPTSQPYQTPGAPPSPSTGKHYPPDAPLQELERRRQPYPQSSYSQPSHAPSSYAYSQQQDHQASSLHPPPISRLAGPPPPPPTSLASYSWQHPSSSHQSSQQHHPPAPVPPPAPPAAPTSSDHHYAPPERRYSYGLPPPPPPPPQQQQHQTYANPPAPPPPPPPVTAYPMATPYSAHEPSPTSYRYDDSRFPETPQKSERPSQQYGDSVKRHLDTFDLESALNDIGQASRSLHDFSSHYSQRAHQTQRSGPLPGSTPHLNEIDEMARHSTRVNESLARLRDVIVSQQAAVAERSKETMHKSVNGLIASEGGQSVDSKDGGFAGSDPKKRRGRAAPPGRCHSCNRAETPEWRRGPDGARTLCNACGLHYAKLTRKMGANKSNVGSSNLKPKSIGSRSPPL